jgi:hypothetical protein
MEKNRGKHLLKQYPFFLLTIAFVFLINIANHYFELLHWEYIVIDLLLYLLIPLVLYFLLGKLWGSFAKAGLLMGAAMIIFYFFYLFHDWINSVFVLSLLGKYIILLPLLLLGVIFFTIYLYKKKSNFHSFYYTTNLIFFLLLAGGIIQYALLHIRNAAEKNDQADPSKALVKNYQPCDTCTRPDIYFILFDGYTNSKTLRTEFDYGNDYIENELHKRDFFIPRHSKSNYNFTHMSIGSELNLHYLANLDKTHRFYTKNFLRSYYTIFHNELCGILKKQGYEINNYSIFDIKEAPVKIRPYLTELTWRSVFGQTFFNKLKRDIGWHLAKFYPKNQVPAEKEKKMETDVKRMDETFKGIIHSIRNPPVKPQFLYAHFLLPHETYYFDSSGNRLDKLYTATTLINKKDYVNQVSFVNRFLMAPIVDSIFKFARRPFVIVVQSDHGYRAYPREKVALEFENFTSFYFPDGDYKMVGDSLSSVNTFRIILNKYFHQNIPLLKDTMINLYKQNSY